MKQLLAILFTALFTFQSIGLFIAFKSKQADIRKEIKLKIKQSVPEDELIVWVFTEDELNLLDWKKSNEFGYKGGMYDIVRRSKSGNNHIFYCINDTQEAKLFEHLNELVANQIQNRQDQQVPLKKVSKLALSSFLPVQPTTLSILFTSNTLLWHYEDQYPIGFSQPQHIPPQYC